MATIVLRCPSCRPHYQVVRTSEKRLGWVVRADYVGYLAVRSEGVKTPPKTCPECGSGLVNGGTP